MIFFRTAFLFLVSGSLLQGEAFVHWENFTDSQWETVRYPERGETTRIMETGSQNPGVRRPRSFRIFKDAYWKSFSLELEARTLEPDSVINRDIVLIYGYIDEFHFNYVHLSSNSDGMIHTVILKVSPSGREVIMEEQLPDPPLTGNWHHFRLVRDEDGNVSVFVDGSDVPLMTSTNKDYRVGGLGFGRFDDTAQFTEPTIKGTPYAVPELQFRENAGALFLDTHVEPNLPFNWAISEDGSSWVMEPLAFPEVDGALKMPPDSSRWVRLLLPLPAKPD